MAKKVKSKRKREEMAQKNKSDDVKPSKKRKLNDSKKRKRIDDEDDMKRGIDNEHAAKKDLKKMAKLMLNKPKQMLLCSVLQCVTRTPSLIPTITSGLKTTEKDEKITALFVKQQQKWKAKQDAEQGQEAPVVNSPVCTVTDGENADYAYATNEDLKTFATFLWRRRHTSRPNLICRLLHCMKCHPSMIPEMKVHFKTTEIDADVRKLYINANETKELAKKKSKTPKNGPPAPKVYTHDSESAMKGTIAAWYHDKGWGLIRSEGIKDLIYCHRSDVWLNDCDRFPKVRSKVMFEFEEAPQGGRARNVTSVNGTNCDSGRWKGTVKCLPTKRKNGRIVTEQGNKTILFKWEDVWQDQETVRAGVRVEYDPDKWNKQCARYVTLEGFLIKFCSCCEQRGHLLSECPQSKKNKVCSQCGKLGHLQRECDGRDTCYNCGEVGHLSRDCSQPQKPKTCYKCNGEGHISRDCPQK